MNKREQQKAATVSEIIRESQVLFAQQGFEKTSIQQIANACGLSKGAMYHHFDSKEAVLEEICRQQYLQLLEKVTPISENRELTALGKLKLFMVTTREESMNMSSYSYAAGGNDIGNAVMEKTLDIYSRKLYVEIIAPILEEARKNGECHFVGPGTSIALYLHSLDDSITIQINRILNEESEENLMPCIEQVLEGFTYVLGQILGITKEQVDDIIQADVLRVNLKSFINLKKSK